MQSVPLNAFEAGFDACFGQIIRRVNPKGHERDPAKTNTRQNHQTPAARTASEKAPQASPHAQYGPPSAAAI
jgi:hypothetical protein